MTYKTRKILFLVFILLFLSASPAIILYANGYGLNLKSGKLEKTGIVMVETEPDGAYIQIDGRRQENFLRSLAGEDSPLQTPAKLTRIAPGKHEITVSLDGYWEWSQKIDIREGESLILDNLLLFSKSMPVLMLKFPDDAWKPESDPSLVPSPSGSLVAAGGLDAVRIYSQEDEILAAAVPTTTALTDIVWSHDSGSILAGNVMFDLGSAKRTDFRSMSGKKLIQCKYSPNGRGRIFCMDSETVYAWTEEEGLRESLGGFKGMADFLPMDDGLVILQKHPEGIMASLINSEGKERRAFEIPGASGDSRFLNSVNGYLLIYDPRAKNLSVIDPDAPFPLVEEIKNAGLFSWNGGTELLYANRQEIWLADIGSKSKRLLARLSGRVTGISWHPRKQHAIFTTETSINIIELAKGGKSDITELFKAENISGPIMTDEDSGILFFARIGSQAGIYKLGI